MSSVCTCVMYAGSCAQVAIIRSQICNKEKISITACGTSLVHMYTYTSTCTMYMYVNVHVYTVYTCTCMLGTDLKPAARFKAVQMYLKPSGRFRSRPDVLRAVQTASKPSVRTNVVTKLSSKRAAKPSLPVENDAVRDPSHSDPLHGYKRRRRYKYDASELDFATPTSSESVSRGALSYSQKAE